MWSWEEKFWKNIFFLSLMQFEIYFSWKFACFSPISTACAVYCTHETNTERTKPARKLIFINCEKQSNSSWNFYAKILNGQVYQSSCVHIHILRIWVFFDAITPEMMSRKIVLDQNFRPRLFITSLAFERYMQEIVPVRVLTSQVKGITLFWTLYHMAQTGCAFYENKLLPEKMLSSSI